MRAQWIIEKKRDGGVLSEAEIRWLICAYTDGEVPDYQMSAFAMAVFFQGMNLDETSALTDAMMRSGDIVDTSRIPGPKADKHSTGGVGDKVSLVLAPLAACCGLVVPQISGRGLGITGGTLDKLESIPGYDTRLGVPRFLETLERCGCSMIGQTDALAPADRKLYALRDATGTVPSIPLICASILSKKLAEGAETLVFDVKWGSGAFMRTFEEARDLARALVRIAANMGRKTAALITDMNQPLGRSAGNAVELVEALDALRGRGPADLMEATLALTAEMLVLSGRHSSASEARTAMRQVLESGAAFAKFREMVDLHGGDVRVIDHPERLPKASLVEALPAPRAGWVAHADAETLGRACHLLGAGRRLVSDRVDHAAGLTEIAKIGSYVEKGEPLLVMRSNAPDQLAEAREVLRDAFVLADEAVEPPPLICEKITPP